jgi:CRP-like cAMP-binding protein
MDNTMFHLLFDEHATVKKVDRNQVIFYEDDEAVYFYAVKSGIIKMINTNDDGKEFIQGVFYEGDSFGEPPLFLKEVYPSSAIAVVESEVVKIPGDIFFKLLEEHKVLQQYCMGTFAQRIYNKAVSAKFIVNCSPEERILGFLQSFRKRSKSPEGKRVLIPFTRQEIANFTALRVETVIRALTKLHKESKVLIERRKLYY